MRVEAVLLALGALPLDRALLLVVLLSLADLVLEGVAVGALILALKNGEAEAESPGTLGIEPGDWLAEWLTLALALARPVAHNPPSPLSSLGQFVELLSSDTVRALLETSKLLAD